GGRFGRPGIPGTPPGIFSASFAISSALGAPPPKPIMLARPASGPRLPLPIIFIRSLMERCILRSLLISSTLVPDPAALRFLRLALSMSGLRRSFAVIDWMIDRKTVVLGKGGG